MDTLDNRVKNALSSQDARVFPLEWGGQRLWIKRAIPAKHRFFHHIQRLGAMVLGRYIPLLYPSVCTGGQEALRAEAARLDRLGRCPGVRVPTLVGQGEGWLAFGDGGMPLSVVFDNPQTPDREVLILKAVHTVVAVHRGGMCLGSGRFRDLLFDGDHITCIDGEEDPSLFMPLAAAQARDVILFLLSSLRHYSTDFTILGRVVHEFQTQEAPDILREIAKVRRVLFLMAPLRLIPQGWLGRDLREGLLLARLLIHHGF